MTSQTTTHWTAAAIAGRSDRPSSSLPPRRTLLQLQACIYEGGRTERRTRRRTGGARHEIPPIRSWPVIVPTATSAPQIRRRRRGRGAKQQVVPVPFWLVPSPGFEPAHHFERGFGLWPVTSTLAHQRSRSASLGPQAALKPPQSRDTISTRARHKTMQSGGKPCKPKL